MTASRDGSDALEVRTKDLPYVTHSMGQATLLSHWRLFLNIRLTYFIVSV